jgi:hypothetical protein
MGTPNTHRWISTLTPSRDWKGDSRRAFKKSKKSVPFFFSSSLRSFRLPSLLLFCRLISNFALPKGPTISSEKNTRTFQLRSSRTICSISNSSRMLLEDTVAVVRSAASGLPRSWNSSKGNTTSSSKSLLMLLRLMNFVIGLPTPPCFLSPSLSHLWE